MQTESDLLNILLPIQYRLKHIIIDNRCKKIKVFCEENVNLILRNTSRIFGSESIVRSYLLNFKQGLNIFCLCKINGWAYFLNNTKVQKTIVTELIIEENFVISLENCETDSPHIASYSIFRDLPNTVYSLELLSLKTYSLSEIDTIHARKNLRGSVPYYSLYQRFSLSKPQSVLLKIILARTHDENVHNGDVCYMIFGNLGHLRPLNYQSEQIEFIRSLVKKRILLLLSYIPGYNKVNTIWAPLLS